MFDYVTEHALIHSLTAKELPQVAHENAKRSEEENQSGEHIDKSIGFGEGSAKREHRSMAQSILTAHRNASLTAKICVQKTIAFRAFFFRSLLISCTSTFPLGTSHTMENEPPSVESRCSEEEEGGERGASENATERSLHEREWKEGKKNWYGKLMKVNIVSS